MARFRRKSKEITMCYSITVSRYGYFAGDVSRYYSRDGFTPEVLAMQHNEPEFPSQCVWIVPGTFDHDT